MSSKSIFFDRPGHHMFSFHIVRAAVSHLLNALYTVESIVNR